MRHNPEYSPDILFEYLEDQVIQKDKSQIWKCIKAVYDQVFLSFLDSMTAKVGVCIAFIMLNINWEFYYMVTVFSRRCVFL